MSHLNLNAIDSQQPLGHALGEVHGTGRDPGEEIGNGLVAAAIATQRFVPVRIRHRPAVEHVNCCQCGNVASPNVANCHFRLRHSAFVREGCDRVLNHDFLPPLRRLVLPFFLAEESLRLGCTGDIKDSISAVSWTWRR